MTNEALIIVYANAIIYILNKIGYRPVEITHVKVQPVVARAVDDSMRDITHAAANPIAPQAMEEQVLRPPVRAQAHVQIEDLLKVLWFDGIRLHNREQRRIHGYRTKFGANEFVRFLGILGQPARHLFFNFLVTANKSSPRALLEIYRNELVELLVERFFNEDRHLPEETSDEALILLHYAMLERSANSIVEDDSPFRFRDEE